MAIDLTNAWCEWHEKCLLDRCSQKNRKELASASECFFRKALSKLPQNVRCIENTRWLAPDKEEKDKSNDKKKKGKSDEEYILRQKSYYFYLMESELLPGDEDERRKYKKRVFENAGEPGKVTGYFFRSFFRSFVKQKKNRSYICPIDENSELNSDEIDKAKTLANQDSALIQKKATPDGVVEANFWVNVAHEFWKPLSEREKAALFAFNHRCPLSSPELLKRVNCGKSVFSQLPGTLIKKYYDMAAAKYNTDYSDIRNMIEALQVCYEEWEKTSELGQWFAENMVIPEKYGMKVRLQKK